MKTVALLYNPPLDQNATDQTDTIIQLEEIGQLLKTAGYNAVPVSFGERMQDAETQLRKLKPDMVFNLVESARGEDRLLYTAAALLEFMGLPYTGCSAAALAVLASKIRQKELLKRFGLPTAPFITLDKPSSDHDGKWIVKSDDRHASFGMDGSNITTDRNKTLELIRAKENKFGGLWFAEAFIVGREFNVSIIQKDGQACVLPVAEMTYNHTPISDRIIDYAAKWDEESFEYDAYQRCFEFEKQDHFIVEKLRTLTLECWHAFGLSGAARVDFRVDNKGNIFILEVNANPCLSADAGLSAAALRAGILHSVLILGLGFLEEKEKAA